MTWRAHGGCHVRSHDKQHVRQVLRLVGKGQRFVGTCAEPGNFVAGSTGRTEFAHLFAGSGEGQPDIGTFAEPAHTVAGTAEGLHFVGARSEPAHSVAGSAEGQRFVGAFAEPAHTVASSAEDPRFVGARAEPAHSAAGGRMVEAEVEEVFRADAIHEGPVAVVEEAARAFDWGGARARVGGNR